MNAISAALLVLAILLQGGCNFPATPSPTVGPTLPENSPRPPVVGWSGTPTLTPFQPGIPVGASSTQPLAERTPANPEAPLPVGTWPPPYFGEPGPTPITPIPPPASVLSGSDTRNFLLVGADLQTSSFRTDTLVIVSLRHTDRQVTLLTIPRDLYVYIPGWTMQRINAAYFHGELADYPGGGPALLKDTILYNLGVHINHLAMVDFAGFRQIVDTLGGIDVPLACPFTDWHIKNPRRSDQDPDNWRLRTIGPGLVHMDGDLALWYARSRLRSSDFDRGRRQQEVLRAIYARGMQLNVLPRLPELYADLRKALTTDLDLDDLLDLTPLAADLAAPRLRSFYINRSTVISWRTPGGAEVLLPEPDAMRSLIRKAMSAPGDDRSSHLAIVEIWNGTPNPDWDVLAAERLHYAGFETHQSISDRRDYERTILYVYTPDHDSAESELLLRALGLPTSRLVRDPQPDNSVAYRLVLGEDYDPCFNPANLQR